MICARCKETKNDAEFYALRKGKPERRRVCKPCRVARSNEWYRDNKEWAGKLTREWKAEHSMQHKEYKRKWAEDNKERAQEQRWRRYGINCTTAQRRAMLVAQSGRCAICKRQESEFKHGLAVDHNHITGKVRGLLCATCNNGVVKTVEDRFHLIERAIEYLKMV